MAKVQLNSALTAIRGRIGNVVLKTYRDKIVMTRVPRLDGVAASPGQRQFRHRIKEATAYAKRVYADPAAKLVITVPPNNVAGSPSGSPWPTTVTPDH